MYGVAHIITTIERGGAEKQLLTLVREQCKNGREVLVVPLKGSPELQDEFEKAGAKVILDLINTSFALQIRLLRRILPYDGLIIHAHLPRAELLASLATNNNRLILSRHNTEPFYPSMPKLISRFLGQFTSGRANLVIAISSAVEDYLYKSREIRGNTEVKVVRYGLDNPPNNLVSTSAREVTNNPGELVIGTIGRLVPQKDYPTLISAFNYLLDEFPLATMVILGDGYLRTSLEELVDELQISNKVNFLGKHSDVDSFLKSLDLFVLASKYEGFGLVLLEAMVQKVPIVASNNSAIPEVLGANHPGLAKTGNAKDFSEKMKQLLLIPGRKNALEIQEIRISKFSPSFMSANMDSLYLSLEQG
jgi:glycosyltransferase involved in cell wall biosynthesis